MREADLANVQAQLIGFDDQGLAAAVGAASADDIPLYAPADGRILRIMQQSETTLPAGAAIMEIGDIEGDLEVIVKLLSTDAVQVSAGDRVVIDDWGGATELQGEVARVDPFGFTQFSALGVEEQRVNTVIEFTENPVAFKNLGHGYRVETRIVVWDGADKLKVPSSALFRSSDSWAVFKVDSGVARIELVDIGNNNGVEAEVLSGLDDKDQVILFPSSGLSNGTKVVQRQVN